MSGLGAKSCCRWSAVLAAWFTADPAGAEQGLAQGARVVLRSKSAQLDWRVCAGQTVGRVMGQLALVAGAASASRTQTTHMPEDTMSQLFPGTDLPISPGSAWVLIEVITHGGDGPALRSGVVCLGRILAVRAPPGPWRRTRRCQVSEARPWRPCSQGSIIVV